MIFAVDIDVGIPSLGQRPKSIRDAGLEILNLGYDIGFWATDLAGELCYFEGSNLASNFLY